MSEGLGELDVRVGKLSVMGWRSTKKISLWVLTRVSGAQMALKPC